MNQREASETLPFVSCVPWQAVKVRILFACLLGVLKKRAFSLRNHPEDFYGTNSGIAFNLCL